MKKTIVIVLLVVYIASIAVVNFFGLESKVIGAVTYVTEIQCNTVTVQNENPVTVEGKVFSGQKWFIFDFKPTDDGSAYTTDAESILGNPNAVQINYEVLPHLADNTEIKFEYDAETNADAIVFHELSKTFVFLKPNRGVTVTIRATDGSNVSTQIVLMGIIPKDSNS